MNSQRGGVVILGVVAMFLVLAGGVIYTNISKQRNVASTDTQRQAFTDITNSEIVHGEDPAEPVSPNDQPEPQKEYPATVEQQNGVITMKTSFGEKVTGECYYHLKNGNTELTFKNTIANSSICLKTINSSDLLEPGEWTLTITFEKRETSTTIIKKPVQFSAYF